MPEPLRTDIVFSRSRRGRRSDRGAARGAGAPAARRRGLGDRDLHPLRHAQLDPRGRALALQLDDRGRAGRDDRPAAARVVLLRRRGARHDRQGRRRGDRRGRRGGRAGADRARAGRAGHRAGADRARRALRPAGLHGARPRRDACGHALAVRARGAGDGDRCLGLGQASVHAGPGGARARRARSVLGGAPGRPALLPNRAFGESRSVAGDRLQGRVLPACGSSGAAPPRPAWWRSSRTSRPSRPAARGRSIRNRPALARGPAPACGSPRPSAARAAAPARCRT